GSFGDPVIRSWDTSAWKQAGDPWSGHGNQGVNNITLNLAGTLLASSSNDGTVRLWQLPAGTEVARFQHTGRAAYVAFSVDGYSMFSSNSNYQILQWEIPEAGPRSGCDKAGPSWGKQLARNRQGLLHSDIPGQRRRALNYECTNRPRGQAAYFVPPRTRAESSLSSPLHNFRTFFTGIRQSSDNKQKECQPKQKAPEVIDVPLGQATYGDVVGVDDGTRPYSLLCCLSWCQKKKKPDLPLPVYDVDLMNEEQEENIANTPIPTSMPHNHLNSPTPASSTLPQIFQLDQIELKPMTNQSQPEAGPSRLAFFDDPRLHSY
ncbi:uncharacterized protein EDB91DRAFT_1173810, partial [Suillus paluster]|uniref:uncharacterized protein n=1 Tax=Suillus paluster TaxID=48578 RepID=UPI001B886C70